MPGWNWIWWLDIPNLTPREREMSDPVQSSDDPKRFLSADRYQLICGVTLGVFAAIMAVNNIGGSRWGAEEIKAANEKSSAYAWYQAKSIKESLMENHRDNVAAELESTRITALHRAVLEKDLLKLNAELQRYKKEKREILEGSESVGEKNWVIAHNGGLGKVKGAKDWEKALKLYEDAGDQFDYSALCLNLAIVLGSISLLISRPSVRNAFFAGMLTFGGIGTYWLITAFIFVGGF